MSLVTMTVKQLKDLGLWESVRRYKGYNPYVLNEGLMDMDSEVTFESNYKDLNVNFQGEQYSREEFKSYIEGELAEIENAERNLKELLSYLIENDYNISNDLESLKESWNKDCGKIISAMMRFDS